MTSLVSWVSYQRKSDHPSAIFFVSDSRITWVSSHNRWECGKKLYSTKFEAHIFGYCGDVVFPVIALAQIADAIDIGIVYSEGDSPEEKNRKIMNLLIKSYGTRRNAPDRDFAILHSFRLSDWPKAEFAVFEICFAAKEKSWKAVRLEIPSKTNLIRSLGSGRNKNADYFYKWKKSDVGGTSRSIYSAFCEGIASAKDPLTGGVPQLLAITSQGPARSFGFFDGESFFFGGAEMDICYHQEKIEFFDKLFQRINTKTKKRRAGARRFARPQM